MQRYANWIYSMPHLIALQKVDEFLENFQTFYSDRARLRD